MYGDHKEGPRNINSQVLALENGLSHQVLEVYQIKSMQDAGLASRLESQRTRILGISPQVPEESSGVDPVRWMNMQAQCLHHLAVMTATASRGAILSLYPHQ